MYVSESVKNISVSKLTVVVWYKISLEHAAHWLPPCLFTLIKALYTIRETGNVLPLGYSTGIPLGAYSFTLTVTRILTLTLLHITATLNVVNSRSVNIFHNVQ